MFTSIYRAIAEALDGQVEHVALWNRNVEFAEQEMAWPRPAAFIEFEPVEWAPNKEAEPTANLTLASRVRVHVVTDYSPDDPLDAFRQAALVRSVLSRVKPGNASRLMLVETIINHDHEELVESIETFQYRGVDYF